MTGSLYSFRILTVGANSTLISMRTLNGYRSPSLSKKIKMLMPLLYVCALRKQASLIRKIFSESLTLSRSSGILSCHFASVAQSAEHNHGKVGVSGSIPLGSFLFL